MNRVFLKSHSWEFDKSSILVFLQIGYSPLGVARAKSKNKTKHNKKQPNYCTIGIVNFTQGFWKQESLHENGNS